MAAARTRLLLLKIICTQGSSYVWKLSVVLFAHMHEQYAPLQLLYSCTPGNLCLHARDLVVDCHTPQKQFAQAYLKTQLLIKKWYLQVHHFLLIWTSSCSFIPVAIHPNIYNLHMKIFGQLTFMKIKFKFM